ncbi:hypothetical protein ABH920_007013 [Catenulispora sp. EB89]|uniref:hypothetical protein n=1 Tax=Catenulispora sp. EB89 TaxID=3156257 RepID=UPI003513DEB7
MKGFTRIALAVCTAGIVLSGGVTAAVAASGGTAEAATAPHAAGVARAAAGLSCSGLDQVFQSPQTGGSYPVTVVSNQPDGIVGFGGTPYGYGGSDGVPGRFSGGQLSGSTGGYLFSDRSTFIPSGGGGFGGSYQPFSVSSLVPLTYTLTRNGAGQYTIGLNFGTGINRQFSFSAQCIGESLVGYTNAIGNNEWTDNATYVVTIGNFVPDPVIH